MTVPDQVPLTSYDPKYFSPLFEAEEKHFWFRSRNAILSKMAAKVSAGLADGFRVLEVGCGTGYVLRMLEKTCARGFVAGMDLFSDGLRFARQRVGVPLIQGDMVRPPLESCFDILCMFDVLEHLPDDVSILRFAGELLKDEGRLLLTVPADPGLWSYFDQASHHYRRYTRDELSQKLELAGFDVEFISLYMLLIYPFVWLTRRLAGGAKGVQPLDEARIEKMTTNELTIIPILNEILTWMLTLEAGWLASGRHLPLGSSLVAVARKRA